MIAAPIIAGRLIPWRTIIVCSVIAMLLVLLAVQTVRIEGFKLWPINIHGLKADLQAERDGRKEDRRRYVEAQRKAAEQNKAEVARIESDQEKVSDKIASDYGDDLARLRAEFMRRHPAPQSPARPANPSSVPEAPQGVDGENVCVPRSFILQAQEIELGRNALIDWLDQQSSIAR